MPQLQRTLTLRQHLPARPLVLSDLQVDHPSHSRGPMCGAESHENQHVTGAWWCDLSTMSADIDFSSQAPILRA
jgi:hypothetical protein